MRAAANAPQLDRLVIEVLARTGLRVGELCALEANAVVRIGATYWLKIPIGKLHTTATCLCTLSWSRWWTPGGPKRPTRTRSF